MVAYTEMISMPESLYKLTTEFLMQSYKKMQHIFLDFSL